MRWTSPPSATPTSTTALTSWAPSPSGPSRRKTRLPARPNRYCFVLFFFLSPPLSPPPLPPLPFSLFSLKRSDGVDHTVTYELIFFFSSSVLSYWDFFNGKFGLLFPRKSRLRQSRATQSTVHAGCFSVSIFHHTMTCATESLTCTSMLVRAVAHGGVRTHARESALKAGSGRKIPYRTGESNLRQLRADPTLYQLSYISILILP